MSIVSHGRPRFITVDEALGFHEVLIAEFGGSTGLRDRALLESALAMPAQGAAGEWFNSFPFGMAAAYAFHIAMNHPFVDGNKRVALTCASAFLRMNGWTLTSESEEAADQILALIAGDLDRDAFAQWLGAHTTARPSIELRDFFRQLSAAQIHDMLQSTALDPDAERADAELAATWEEAKRAAPAIVEFTQLAGTVEDATSRAVFLTQLGFLVALYRIAEDLGYEWE